MSRSIDIFLQSDKPTAAVAAELGAMLGFELKAHEKEFVYLDDQKVLYVHGNDYEDDLGIRFSKYQHVLAIRTSPRAFQDELAGKFWEQLASKTSYPLMMTEDTQLVLKRRE